MRHPPAERRPVKRFKPGIALRRTTSAVLALIADARDAIHDARQHRNWWGHTAVAALVSSLVADARREHSYRAWKRRWDRREDAPQMALAFPEDPRAWRDTNEVPIDRVDITNWSPDR